MLKKIGIGCGGLIALFIVLGVVGSLAGTKSAPASSLTPAVGTAAGTNTSATLAPTRAKTWTVVKQWSGSGIKDTETFTVGAEWRIDWDYTPPADGGILQLYVYDSKGQLIDIVANTQKSGPDTSFQHRAGTYYLKVNAVGDWKVDVQDMR